MEKIILELNEIFQRIFDNSNLTIREDTTAKDIEEWDSLNHIQLIVAIERHFQIKFTSSEILIWKNVGEICKAIQNRLDQKNNDK